MRTTTAKARVQSPGGPGSTKGLPKAKPKSRSRSGRTPSAKDGYEVATTPAKKKQAPKTKATGKKSAADVKAAKDLAAARKANFEARQKLPDGRVRWRIPPLEVPDSEIVTNNDPNTRWVEKWKSPTTGKWVYNYTVDQIEQAAGEKFAKNAQFAKALPVIREQVAKDINGGGKEKVLALIVAMIDQACFRIGNPESEKHGVHGITTLKKRHLKKITGQKAEFEYVGKKKQDQYKVVEGAQVVKLLKSLRRSAKGPEARLFTYKGQPISEQDVNNYLSEFGVTAKMFRTFHATRIAREILLAAMPCPADKREAAVTAMFKQVSDQPLGNTPAVAQESYVDPKVVEDFMAGKLKPSKTGA